MKVKIADASIKALVVVVMIVFLVYVGICVGMSVAFKQMQGLIDEAKERTEITIVTEEAEEEIEQSFYCEEVPLSYTEQQDLYNAAEEFGVDYYTMLGLIEKETNFRNVYGDGGNAYGYCQIWHKWWKGLMLEIGAKDLNVPKDNFRTACAIVSELTDRYGSTAGALTAYNKGSYNGNVTQYAVRVMENAEKWREI